MAKRKQPGLYPTPQKKAEFELRRYQMLELYKGGATEKQSGRPWAWTSPRFTGRSSASSTTSP